MFKFSVWDFSEKEISQVVEIVKFAFTGEYNELFKGHYCLDTRKVRANSQVFRWAKSRGLLATGEEIDKTTYGRTPYYIKAKGKHRWYLKPLHGFSPLTDCPIEALFRITRPIIDQSHGGRFTICSNPLWRNLGIWELGSKEWDRVDDYEKEFKNNHITYGQNKFLPFIINVLNLLARHGYIIFQHAGSIWQITKLYE